MSVYNELLAKVFGIYLVRREKLERLTTNAKSVSGIQLISEFYRQPSISVDTEMSEQEQEAIFSRIQKVWMDYGNTEPYWSMLTAPQFRSDKIDDLALDHFYASGSDTAKLINEFFDRSGNKPIRGTCLEFGCGVGRVTLQLAHSFDKVIAVDISKGNLDLAQKRAIQLGLNNIEFKLVQTFNDVLLVDSFDFLFSTIVLQHNPPPFQKLLLDSLLGKIRIGGGCLFQLPTEHPGSSFKLSKYLATKADSMEMHSLPMQDVFRLIEKHKIQLLEVRPDGWTGETGSFTFFAYPKAA